MYASRLKVGFFRIFSCWEKNIYLSAGISDTASRYLSPEVEAFFIPRVKKRLEIISNLNRGQIFERNGLRHTYMKEEYLHKVGRVLSFFFSRRNWDSPNPSTAGECAPPPPVLGGGIHSLATEGL